MNKINLNQQTQKKNKKKQDEKQKIIVMEIVEIITNIVEIKHLFLSFYLPWMFNHYFNLSNKLRALYNEFMACSFLSHLCN